MRNVIVTGGSRGIGATVARRLALDGFSVIAVARRTAEPLDAAIAEVAAGGVGALCFRQCDLAEIGAIPDFVKAVRGDCGPLYGLVNNAGLGTGGVLANMPDSAIGRLIELNVTSPITLTKYVVRSMMAAGGGGRVVNMASIVGRTGYSGLSAYSATKAALAGFTRSLAREVGTLGITVNAVSPGFIDTEMTHAMDEKKRRQLIRRSALGRMAEAGDVAEAVAFLFGEGARNITGTDTVVDAGNTA